MMLRRGAVIVALLSVCLVMRPSRLAAQDTRGVGVGGGVDTAGLAASKFHAILLAVQDYSDPNLPKL
jgi:hypothetical protein